MARSMLHRLEELCNVDVDDVDTEVIKSIPFTPHNRTYSFLLSPSPLFRDGGTNETARFAAETSNQAIITNALLADEPLLKDLVRQYGSQGWERVYDQAVCPTQNLHHSLTRSLSQPYINSSLSLT